MQKIFLKLGGIGLILLFPERCGEAMILESRRRCRRSNDHSSTSLSHFLFLRDDVRKADDDDVFWVM